MDNQRDVVDCPENNKSRPFLLLSELRNRDEITAASASQPPHPTAAPSICKRNSVGLGSLENHSMYFAVSLKEGLCYVKALLPGQAKKLTAKDEKEATEADLRASRMQVETADVTEDAKMRIQKSV